MDSEFLQNSLVVLQNRYADLLSLHNARTSSEAFELQKLSVSSKAQIGELKKQLEAKTLELQKIVVERDVQAKESEKVLKELSKQKVESEQKIEELSKQKVESEQKIEELSKQKVESEQKIEELSKQLQLVSQSLVEKEALASDSSEEAELLLLQLHQVQEELERYFLVSRRQAKMLNASENVANKAFELISKLA